jgi:hypothetical protein
VIVYNVQRRWFTMKSDADIHRRNLKLPPAALFTLRIDDRDDLAGLLNGLCGQEPPVAPLMVDPAVAPVIERNQIANEPPDFVPAFLVREWQQKCK